MSSREISDMTGVRHDNVRRTIETLAERGVITVPQIEESPPPAHGGKPTKAYTFSGEQGKRDSIVVVAQLCPEFTARLVDRWQELERHAAQGGVLAEARAEQVGRRKVAPVGTLLISEPGSHPRSP